MKRIFLYLLFLTLNLTVWGQNGTFKHPWTGKHIGIIGDSVSDSIYCYPHVKRYYSYLADWLDATTYSTAISGLEWKSIPFQLEQMSKRTNDRNLDVVLVFLGTNDYNMGVPIGEWYTEETTQVEASTGEMKQFYTRQHRQFVMSEDTYCGRINLGITKIRQQYPQATIVLLTPLHRALFDAGDHNLQPDELYHNKCGEFLDAYVNKIKEAAGIWSVYVIDLQSVSGIMPLMEEHSIYMSGEKDKLHPSATGHERLAEVLLYQTFSMP